jgi:hypothetical protein
MVLELYKTLTHTEKSFGVLLIIDLGNRACEACSIDTAVMLTLPISLITTAPSPSNAQHSPGMTQACNIQAETLSKIFSKPPKNKNRKMNSRVIPWQSKHL